MWLNFENIFGKGRLVFWGQILKKGKAKCVVVTFRILFAWEGYILIEEGSSQPLHLRAGDSSRAVYTR